MSEPNWENSEILLFFDILAHNSKTNHPKALEVGLINFYQIFTVQMTLLGAYVSEYWLFQAFFSPLSPLIDEIVLPPCVQTAISRKPFELQGWD